MFSSIWKAIKAIVKKVLSFIKSFLKKFGVILLVVAAFWFAPAIAGFLSSAGAPSWLSGAFSWIATTFTPTVVSAGQWLLSGAAKLGSWVKAGWASLTFGQKATLAIGAAGLIAPQEVGQALESTAATVAGIAGSAVGAVATGFVTSPLGFALLAGAVWFFFLRDNDDNQVRTQ